MNKKRWISLFLCLALGVGFGIPATIAGAETGDSGMMLSKTAAANGDGTYTVTLEAYATGSKVITHVTEEIPTDIILVLDESGSMDYDMTGASFSEYKNSSGTHYKNSSLYGYRHNGGSNNLWYALPDGSYASVSVVMTSGFSALNNPTNQTLNTNANNLYAKIDGEYKKVTVTKRYTTYTYTIDGISITSTGNYGQPDPSAFLGFEGWYTVSTVADTYNYYYTDADGNAILIESLVGGDSRPTSVFYSRSNTTKRIAALRSALYSFESAVAAKAAGADGTLGTGDDVNHRIAVVGFSSAARLYIGSTAYSGGAAGQYGQALQDMDTQQGQNNVNASIGSLMTNGGTHPDLGLSMADGILDANPVDPGGKRNRVVILFTDGVPGDYGFDSGIAGSAIGAAGGLKGEGVTVYSIGIFDGADASSAGNSSGNEIQKANWYMQQVSSNNGVPQSPSYYLSASDAGALASIFQQISSQIESGGSSSTLTEETVIRDIISPSFQLPEGASSDSITLETYSCTGKSGDDYLWRANNDTLGAQAAVNGDRVDITGFDFSENYVGTVTENGTVTYRGSKLVIRFVVEPKPGFLGGNDVFTNTSAGVYENGDSEIPILTFEKPTVNVAIPEVAAECADRKVYLLESLTAQELLSAGRIAVGETELDLSAENFGLEPWQNAYVDIAVMLLDGDGNAVTSFSDLTEDAVYALRVSVAPKTDGTGSSGTPASEQTQTGEAQIHVYKPVLTFRDREVFFGEDAPETYSGELVSVQWKHGETSADSSMGAAPELTVACTPDSAALLDGKINTASDVGVAAAVGMGEREITRYCTMLHENCAGKECDVPEGYHFLLHVKTCTLTIVKSGAEVAGDQSFVFRVCGKPGTPTADVSATVVINGAGSKTVCCLPVGEYTVTEESGWSWRYSPEALSQSITVSAGGGNTVTFRNDLTNPYWLSGNSYAYNLFTGTN